MVALVSSPVAASILLAMEAGMADSFGINNDVVLLAPLPVLYNPVNQHLFVAVIPFRQKNVLRAVGNTAPKRNIARMASHNLNDTAPFMGCGCISYLIYGLHRRIDSRVKTDGIIGTGNIKIDGSGESDRVYTESRKLARTAVRTVSSDDHQTVNTVFLTNLSPFFWPSTVVNSGHRAV